MAQTGHLGSTIIIPKHPRILLLRGQEQSIKNNILSDNSLNKINGVILSESDKMLLLPVSGKKLVGRRLLNVSRESLRRLFFLSYAFRLTHNYKYFKRAEEELVSLCSFDDWNPSHFLDVAEMTMGISIAYDWLYDNLSNSDRTLIKSAIIKKGLQPSLDSKNNTWLSWTNNWNQVCNAGMAYGALAIYEDNPSLAKTIINRAIGTIRVSMNDEYAPNGCFLEGYSYWDYGTGFNVMLISALQKAFGDDFGLKSQPGFMQTARYMENMTGPTKKSFNYSDSFDSSGLLPDEAMFWFASQLKDPSLLWFEYDYLLNSKPNAFTANRLLPTVMIWDTGLNPKKITPPTSNLWVGQGKNPVAMMRTSWKDPNAIYVGVKAGSPSISHGHMDIGSFVMDANGVRWAMDLGGTDYTAIEAKSINIWDFSQNSQRWTLIPQYNNMSHNTLTINNGLQKVNGNADFVSSSSTQSFINVITDLTSIYKDDLSKSLRGVAIVNGSYVVIRDEITAILPEAFVKWTMLTPASVKIISNNKAELMQNGEKLILQVQEPSNVVLKTWLVKFDEGTNQNNVFVGFETKLPGTTVNAITVLLIPQSSQNQQIQKVTELKNWPK